VTIRIGLFLLAAATVQASLVIHIRTPRGIVACADKRVIGAQTSDRYIKLIPNGDACVYAVTGSANTFWNKSHTELEYSIYTVIEKFLEAMPCSDHAVDLEALGREIERSMLAGVRHGRVEPPAPSSVVILIHRDDGGRLRTGRCRITTRLNEQNVITAVKSECKDTSAEKVLAYGDGSYLKQLPPGSIDDADAVAAAKALIHSSAEYVAAHGGGDISPESDCLLLPQTGGILWNSPPQGEYPPGHPK
jgi:hypothetical protein